MHTEGQTKIAFVFAVGLVVGVALGYYVAGVKGATIDIISTAPSLTEEQKLGTEPLSADEQRAVAFHKNEIARRATFPEPLSATERRIIGDIIIGGFTVYDFTPEERALLSRAFSAQ